MAAVVAHAADPDALWKIVHGRCVPDMAEHGDPAPCAEVSPDWAVLKDRLGNTQFLLIPTAKVTGIEDPAVLAPGAPNYFAAAWAARRWVEQRAGHPIPASVIGTAINAEDARSQNQLHIHVDCLQPSVTKALASLPAGAGWVAMPAPLAGQRLEALRLTTDIAGANPFTLAAQHTGRAIGQDTLILTHPGEQFVLLLGISGEGSDGHGEDLLDHDCAAAANPR